MITCENFILFTPLVPNYQFLNCFVNNFLENLEEKKITVLFCFREGWLGYS